MARTALTRVTMPGSIDYDGTALTFEAADTSNGNYFVSTGKEILIAQNTSGGALWADVTSVADSLGRTKDINQVDVAAGGFTIFGPFDTTGWRNTSGNIDVDAESTSIKFLVLVIP